MVVPAEGPKHHRHKFSSGPPPLPSPAPLLLSLSQLVGLLSAFLHFPAHCFSQLLRMELRASHSQAKALPLGQAPAPSLDSDGLIYFNFSADYTGHLLYLLSSPSLRRDQESCILFPEQNKSCCPSCYQCLI